MEIILVTGQSALIDDEDLDLIGNYKWRVTDKKGNHIRRVTSYLVEGKRIQKTIYLHRIILEKHKTDLTNVCVDHIDRDPLNCCKANLRVASIAENSRNVSTRKDNTTGFKGVHKTKDGCYQAKIRVNGERVYLGTYRTAEAASESYNKAALKYHQNFAFTNS